MNRQRGLWSAVAALLLTGVGAIVGGQTYEGPAVHLGTPPDSVTPVAGPVLGSPLPANQGASAELQLEVGPPATPAQRLQIPVLLPQAPAVPPASVQAVAAEADLPPLPAPPVNRGDTFQEMPRGSTDPVAQESLVQAWPLPLMPGLQIGPLTGETQVRLLEVEVQNANLRRRLLELTDKFDILATTFKKKEAQHEAIESELLQQARRGGAKAKAMGFGKPKSSRPEPMYHIGLFWWRDNTKEIADRVPYYPDMAPAEHEICEGVTFGDGLMWQTQDKYFRLIFHNLTQMDEREPIQQGEPLHGGFIIPRQRWYFEGSVGDYADFVTSINRGYSTLDLLDSYVDFNVNREYLKFRVGRFKMPSQYEYIDIAEADLLGPERSLYVANYAANRQLGVMAHGYLFERRFHYYVAASNGPRRSFEDYNSSRDFFFYGDYMPFVTYEDSFLQNLHLVSAYNFGEERNPVSPSSLQTQNQLSNGPASLTVSPIIAEFNTNAIENGPRQAWSQEVVYYYKSFGLLGGAQGGYQDYSVTKNAVTGFQNASGDLLGVNSANRIHVPIYGWSVGGWYFITGEEISRRRFLVEPVNPFGYYNGGIHTGAIELFSRVSNLQLGDSVFNQNLINRADWTNRATSLDFGVNWYLNHFVKFTFDYQHTFLGAPVLLDPVGDKRTKQYDSFLFRTQLYF